MNLDQVYSLRRTFTVIGMTGRTGSGCSDIAEILCGTYNELAFKGLRDEPTFTDEIFARKYAICKNYLSYPGNWIPFEIIKYVDVLLFFIMNKYGGNLVKTKELLSKYYFEKRKEDNRIHVANVMSEIGKLHTKYSNTINDIKQLKNFRDIRADKDLLKLEKVFFGKEFKSLSLEIFKALEEEGYFRTRILLHLVSCNIRSTGDPLREDIESDKFIYSIAELINRLIKAKRIYNREFRNNHPTKIVIDSLRNSLEIMYFKQRFGAFYMIATKDVTEKSKTNITNKLINKIADPIERERIVDLLIDLDETEYRTKDFSKGKFSSPDVENCIQKSDFHVLNIERNDISMHPGDQVNGFLSREEQLMKFVTLVQQPGLITPSSAERAMQIANTARLNSGCISRKVGAVITDKNYYIKAIGWNDVAKGHTPCNLRSVTDYLHISSLEANPHYSAFEKGEHSPHSSFNYKNDTLGNFKNALVHYFNDAYKKNSNNLNGKNCSFCFKTVHNHYEGESNQVHTRSLHAEENAMLQLTKLGGMGVNGGFLFTTASPCELCSKKAYQLGIEKIFYIDPYPGIAVDQILKGGSNKPKLIPFSGAIGNAYDWLYESFMSYKDELTMTLELKPKANLEKEFSNILKATDDPDIKSFAQENKFTEKEIIEILQGAIINKKSMQSE